MTKRTPKPVAVTQRWRLSLPAWRRLCACSGTRSNNPGILRWAVNHDRCYEFWIENGAECSNCIAACPFTRRYSGNRQTRNSKS